MSFSSLRVYSLVYSLLSNACNNCLIHFVCFMGAHGGNASLASATPSFLLGKAGLTVVEAFAFCSLSSMCSC